MKGQRYHTISNLRQDPPEQRQWLRDAAALAHVFRTRHVPEVPPAAVVPVVMLAADFLWASVGSNATFRAFRADAFVGMLSMKLVASQSTFKLYAEIARALEGAIELDPTLLDGLPLPLIEETQDVMIIPLGRSEAGTTLRDRIRQARRRAIAPRVARA